LLSGFFLHLKSTCLPISYPEAVHTDVPARLGDMFSKPCNPLIDKVCTARAADWYLHTPSPLRSCRRRRRLPIRYIDVLYTLLVHLLEPKLPDLSIERRPRWPERIPWFSCRKRACFRHMCIADHDVIVTQTLRLHVAGETRYKHPHLFFDNDGSLASCRERGISREPATVTNCRSSASGK
jgi:hypothetical protein